MSNPSNEAYQSLKTWFARGMFTGNAKAMIKRYIDLMGKKGEKITTEDVKRWMAKERVRLSENERTRGLFAEAMLWAKSNPNPSPWERSQWYRDFNTTTTPSAPQNTTPVVSATNPPTKRFLITGGQLTEPITPDTQEFGVPVSEAGSSRLPTPSSQAQTRTESFLLPTKERVSKKKKRVRKTQLQLLLDTHQTLPPSFFISVTRLITTGSGEEEGWAGRLRPRRPIRYSAGGKARRASD